MSDTEDQLILEEIRALENALSKEKALHSKPEECEVRLKTEIITETDHSAEESQTHSKLYTSRRSISFNDDENVIENSASALKLNQDLIQRLMATRSEIVEILEECKRKKAIVDSKVKTRLKLTPNLKTLSSHAGMPYFKDKDFFPVPPNEDTKLKEANGELQIIHLRRVSRWTAKDKELLLKRIHEEVVSGLKNLNEVEEDDIENMTLGKSHSLPDAVIKAIGPLGTREFDWMKIAVTDFQNKHSPEECRVMWNVFLHPDINKFKWKKKELSDLEKYVKKYKNQNWDSIAKELGTKRSGYQCFVKFNTIKKVPQNDKPWSKQEDKKLIQLINKFKVGDFINWGDVASCVDSRTKQQIYFRWTYSLAPHLKKGRFTEEEDKLLIDAIEKYGLNFKKISSLVLPARTSAQLSDHYNTMANKKENIWTMEQDSRLLELYHEYGNDWAKISTFFNAKGRVQLRHRYTALMRFARRGLGLNEINRNLFRDKASKDFVVFKKVPIVIGQKSRHPTDFDETDKEIIKYFQSVHAPPSKAGRKQKFYNANELESITKKLYNILQLMSVNLKIPYDLDEYDCLTEKDKQLLNSLKNLPYDVTYGAISRKVEQMRIKMFDSDLVSKEEEEEDEHFIPPLPFGGYIKTSKVNQMINYSLYIDTNFVLDEEMKLKTPNNVIESIGDEVDKQFEKLGELLVKPKYRSEKQARQSIFILTPEDFNKRAAESRNQKIETQIRYLPSTSKASIPEVRILESYSKSNMFNDYEMENFPAMKPSYGSLIGYQRLLNAVKDNTNECSNFEEKKMSEKGRMALELLRTRLVQIFKYPMIMSQVMPPETIQESQSLFLSPEKEKDVSSEPKRKKRKIAKANI